MKHWQKIALRVVGAVLAAGIVAVVVGKIVWNRQVARTVARLEPARATAATETPSRYSADEIGGLPAPVARYFRYALTPGQPLVERAHIKWSGDFLIRPGSWSPFTADQVYVVHPPGFLWNAAIRMAPMTAVHVRDSYVQGEGRMRGEVAGLFSVVDEGGTPEMAISALQRYLAECVWFPTGLLPSAGVKWQAIDDSTARATLVDRAVTAVVQFHFAPTGEIVRISARRYRSDHGEMVPTTWVGSVSEYERRQGMMVPTSGEVEWEMQEGRLPYWRGRVVEIRYEPAGPGD